jgi:hypothetical protein
MPYNSTIEVFLSVHKDSLFISQNLAIALPFSNCTMGFTW